MASVLEPEIKQNSDSAEELQYMPGFSNEHCSEAIEGSLPQGQFSPQRVAHGLYAEKFTATAFTAPRTSNFRNWFYRIRPSVIQGDFQRIDNGLIRSGPITEVETPPNQLRWDPLPLPDKDQDFIDGLEATARDVRRGERRWTASRK